MRGFLPLIPFSTFLLLLPPLRFCLNRGQRRPEWFSFLQSHTRLLALFPACICGEESSGVTHGVFKLVNLLNYCTPSSNLPPGGFSACQLQHDVVGPALACMRKASHAKGESDRACINNAHALLLSS